MASLSDEADNFNAMESFFQDRLIVQMCEAIESLTEARVAASSHIEALQLRIEELEAQVSQLAPPKSVGAVVVPAWKKLSESDLPAEGE